MAEPLYSAFLHQRWWAALGSTYPWLSLCSAVNFDPEGTNSWRLSLTSLGQQSKEGSEQDISMSMTHMKKLECMKRVTRIVIMLNMKKCHLWNLPRLSQRWEKGGIFKYLIICKVNEVLNFMYCWRKLGPNDKKIFKGICVQYNKQY